MSHKVKFSKKPYKDINEAIFRNEGMPLSWWLAHYLQDTTDGKSMAYYVAIKRARIAFDVALKPIGDEIYALRAKKQTVPRDLKIRYTKAYATAQANLEKEMAQAFLDYVKFWDDFEDEEIIN